jgi:AAA domain-containing protein
MLTAASNLWTKFFSLRHQAPVPDDYRESIRPLRPVGLREFLRLEIPTREMLLNPILPERSLSMLYAPRGLGKSWLALSIGLTVASGSQLLRWSAPRKRRVLYVDGEMPLVALQERLQALSVAAGDIANDGFQLLAADYVESGINLSCEEGQQSVEALLPETDLLILDNLSTLCSGRSENASDAWLPMQQWLLRLRRKGLAVLLVHHAGNNGRQRGTSRREDALDTVIALRRPGNYSPDQGCRFEIHFEKLRNRVDPGAAAPFEGSLETVLAAGHEVARWTDQDLVPPILKRAAELFEDGLTVREVAAALKISKSEAGRLRLQCLRERQEMFVPGGLPTEYPCPKVPEPL